jgi:hypothetical protein
VESVSGFAVFIGGKNSAFGTILLIVMGLAILFSVVGFSWPRPRLRKGPDGWKLQTGSAVVPRNTSQLAFLYRLLICIAVIVVMWLLIRSN